MPDLSVGNYIFSETSGVFKTTAVNRKDLSSESLKAVTNHYDKRASISLRDRCRNLSGTLQPFAAKKGVHSSIRMISAGLPYTNNDDTARCNTCGLEVSGWTSDMEPFTIHKQRSPTCTFVLSMLTSEKISTDSPNKPSEIGSTSKVQESPQPQVQTDTYVANSLSHILVEVNTLKQIRKRTFSHWPHQSSPSASQMIQAGFFSCNVGDRVICIYCNIVCQQWTPNNEDPCEVHKTLSPKCPYVIAMSTVFQTTSTSPEQKKSPNNDSQQIIANVNRTACHRKYVEAKKRLASFDTWPNDNLPSVDDLVKAGFFYTGTKRMVTCFYCNGSLQNLSANDIPMTEHARWFPHCAYAKQLCGAELYQKIQELKRVQQGKINTNDSRNALGTGHDNSIDEHLLVVDENTLSELVVARLDLPISQSLLDRKFKLSIIKKCWEDQLRFKHNDFASDCDLLMACILIQKQINGKNEKINVPSVAMRSICNQEGAENILRESHAYKMQPINPCILCLEEEKCLACIPCGHLITCVPCGQVYSACPMCHAKIDAFVRIYI